MSDNQQQARIREINISHEMRTSFLDYAMSVIVSVHYQMFVMD